MAFTQLPFHPMTSEIEAQTLKSPAFDVGGMTELDVVLKINAMGATGTVDITIEHSMDMKDWYSLGTVITDGAGGAATRVKSFSDFMRYVRGETVITGAGTSVTYSLLGIAKEGT